MQWPLVQTTSLNTFAYLCAHLCVLFTFKRRFEWTIFFTRTAYSSWLNFTSNAILDPHGQDTATRSHRASLDVINAIQAINNFHSNSPPKGPDIGFGRRDTQKRAEALLVKGQKIDAPTNDRSKRSEAPSKKQNSDAASNNRPNRNKIPPTESHDKLESDDDGHISTAVVWKDRQSIPPYIF